MTRALHIAHTVLCLGLNLLLARLKLDPRWKYALWGVIIANEIRGITVVYLTGDAALEGAMAWLR